MPTCRISLVPQLVLSGIAHIDSQSIRLTNGWAFTNSLSLVIKIFITSRIFTDIFLLPKVSVLPIPVVARSQRK